MEFNCLKDTEPLRGDSLLFTFKSPGVPGTHFIYLERMKAESNLKTPIFFKSRTLWLGIQRLNHYAITSTPDPKEL